VLTRRSVFLSITAGFVTSLLATGCQSAGVVDKAGGNVIVLRLATIDDLDSNGQTIAPATFIKTLERVSGGRMKTTLQTSYENGSVTAETDIVKAIISGKLDGGWPSTRGFSRAGIRSLEPVEAPLTLTSYAAQKALVTGPAGRALLSTLKGSGLVGLGLSVGPLRRPWSTLAPLVDVRHWHGATFRSYNSPMQEKTIRALGGVPVPASYGFPDLVESGKLRGAETDVAQYAKNEYGALLPWAVGNEVLWPRTLVLSLSQTRFNSLTAEQQGWIRDAAKEAVDASVNFGYDDNALAVQLCSVGVRFIDANPEQLKALRRAVQPVIDALARDPATSPSLAQVRGVAAKFPSPETVRVPAACRKPQ